MAFEQVSGEGDWQEERGVRRRGHGRLRCRSNTEHQAVRRKVAWVAGDEQWKVIKRNYSVRRDSEELTTKSFVPSFYRPGLRPSQEEGFEMPVCVRFGQGAFFGGGGVSVKVLRGNRAARTYRDA